MEHLIELTDSLRVLIALGVELRLLLSELFQLKLQLLGGEGSQGRAKLIQSGAATQRAQAIPNLVSELEQMAFLSVVPFFDEDFHHI